VTWEGGKRAADERRFTRIRNMSCCMFVIRFIRVNPRLAMAAFHFDMPASQRMLLRHPGAVQFTNYEI